MFSFNRVLLPVTLLFAIVFSWCVDGFIFPRTENDLVMGSKEAAVGQFPYQASVQKQMKKPKRGYKHICGGSIITNRFILTVAHCYDPEFDYRIVVGANNLRNSGTAYRANRWIRHENFYAVGTKIRNNIALIQTDEKIKFNPMTLFPIPLGHRFIRGGGTAVVSGWGRSQVRHISIYFSTFHILNIFPFSTSS